MNTSLKHLSFLQRKQLKDVVGLIIKAVHPEKIILFGVHSVPGAAALFNQGAPSVAAPFDLLVVTHAQDRRSDYELQDILENRCRHVGPVTTIVHDIDYVNRQLAARQYFFSTTCMEGILVYDNKKTLLEKASLPDFEQVRQLAEKDFDRWSGQAFAFFKSARFNLQQREWKIATFMLHQAAEQIYQAILLAFTGYKPTTHNLDKLRRYTNRFSIELASLFPKDSPDEEYLFRLLLSGYVDARYKDQYMVSEKEVVELTSRIEHLLDIAGRVCRNHFLSLEKRALNPG
ncbi:MAG: HEPN domain-containing protein [Bacteroidetes bacterium]|nr:HEPN domain-containing protein [Bacteroidota bacterium]